MSWKNIADCGCNVDCFTEMRRVQALVFSFLFFFGGFCDFPEITFLVSLATLPFEAFSGWRRAAKGQLRVVPFVTILRDIPGLFYVIFIFIFLFHNLCIC